MTPIRTETGLPPVTLIQALLPAAGSGDPPSQSAQWINLLQLGQRIIVEVQAHLTDGSFLVKVGDATTRMNLPSATTVGEKITLTVVDKSPLPTFILNANPSAPIDSSNMSLSNAGKLIAAILQLSGESAATPVPGKSPLMPQANFPAPLLANALEQTLTQSGLFYESHLHQWVNGQRTITELMNEPQASQTAQISNLGAVNNIVPAIPVTKPANTSSMVNSLATTALPVTDKPADLTINNPVLAQLVHQQLHTLEQNRFLWQGELWPGQTLNWEISDDTPRDNQTLPHSIWSSKVSFDLPLLGKVIAHLRLNDDQLTMQISADKSALQQLQAHSGSLSHGLQVAGISLTALQMTSHA